MKRTISFVLALLLVLFSFSACGAEKTEEQPVQKTVRLATLKGPTGIGTVKLMEQNEASKTTNKYEVTLCSDPTEILSGIVGNNFDVAACPLNMASVLHNKTQGNVQILAVNTLGTLYLVSTQEISSIKDLAGKTIVAAGKGASPEYVLNYLLEKNGIADKVTVEYKSEHAEVATLATAATAEDSTLYLLPEPNVTVTSLKNSALKVALDLSKEFEAQSGVALAMGCIVARKDYIDANQDAVKAFLKEYEKSVAYTADNLNGTAKLCEQYGIVPKEAVAKKAIPNCNITFKTGEEMQKIVNENLKVLFDANPKSVGGKLPGEELFYVAK